MLGCVVVKGSLTARKYSTEAPLDKMFSLLFIIIGERVNISFRKNFLIDIKSGMVLIKCIECV